MFLRFFTPKCLNFRAKIQKLEIFFNFWRENSNIFKIEMLIFSGKIQKDSKFKMFEFSRQNVQIQKPENMFNFQRKNSNTETKIKTLFKNWIFKIFPVIFGTPNDFGAKIPIFFKN